MWPHRCKWVRRQRPVSRATAPWGFRSARREAGALSSLDRRKPTRRFRKGRREAVFLFAQIIFPMSAIGTKRTSRFCTAHVRF